MALDPEFTKGISFEILFIVDDIAKLDGNQSVYHVPSGDDYIPGMMGMNVVGKADYVNVVVQALSHISPIRNFFLQSENYSYSKSPLVFAFGSLMRKLWSHSRFKVNVTPHEVVSKLILSFLVSK